MKNKLIMAAAVLALAGFGSTNVTAGPTTISYSSTPNSAINFDGAGNFSFSPASDSFAVTSGTASGFLGDISGTFAIGTISGSSAPVTGTGTFVINDGATPFTATVNWINIVQSGVGNTLNDFGSINLTGVSYGGSNPDLVALATDNDIDVLTFSFIPAQTLAQLVSSKEHSSFQGTITSAPDGGTTVSLLGLALGVCGVFARKFKHA